MSSRVITPATFATTSGVVEFAGRRLGQVTTAMLLGTVGGVERGEPIPGKPVSSAVLLGHVRGNPRP
jgi:hypothetical protein